MQADPGLEATISADAGTKPRVQDDSSAQQHPESCSPVISTDKKADTGAIQQNRDDESKLKKQPADEKYSPQPEPQNDESIHWSSFACELGLEGLAQEIALNCTLESLQQDYLCLNLTSELLELVNPIIEEEIRQAIEIKLGVSLKLELLAQDELDVETPQQYKQRILQDHRQATIEAIRHDATVQKLNDAFGAELIESSVRKINR
ncbi:MAG: DNA polymerase III subunit gamma/tau C-terminal domain-containing protein [Planctomycetota bacterium]